MKIILDTKKNERKIMKSIKRYGFFAEHNYSHYTFLENHGQKNIAFDFGNDRMILAKFYNNIWQLFPCGVLSKPEERIDLLEIFLRYALIENNAYKVNVEIDESLRNHIAKKNSFNRKFRSLKPVILYWPVYNLSAWDNKLKGGRLKKLRNIYNRFSKNFDVRAESSCLIEKDSLVKIINRWILMRGNNDRVNKKYYFDIIKNDFKGFDFARTLMINNNPCTITAGWKIPNTNSFYSAVGIYDYSYKYLGDFLNLEDLNFLKSHGFDYADFGGSGKSLLAFKKKFKPHKIYKTYKFTIIKNVK